MQVPELDLVITVNHGTMIEPMILPRASLAPGLICEFPGHDGGFVYISANKYLDVVFEGILLEFVESGAVPERVSWLTMTLVFV